MKRIKKFSALLLTLAMLLSLIPAMALTAAAEGSYDFYDLRNSENITAETLSGTVDGKPLTVTHYSGFYAEKHNSDDQRINIYVPSSGDADSAIFFICNNGGWFMNKFPSTIEDGFAYETGTADASNVALALRRGMTVVSYGARSRGQQAENGSYFGHSPATVVDTKAAIRYLRYNSNLYSSGKSDLCIGDTDRIFVTGTSGGGGLTAVIAATGNNSDYFEALYEIGAAGIVKTAEGCASVSGLGDEVLGTVSYCPIIELAMSGSSYEWTYNTSRASRAASWANNGGSEDSGKIPDFEENDVMQASAWYAQSFADYINGLQLRDENGSLLTATYTRKDGALAGVTGGSFKTAMQALLEKGINKAIAEWNDTGSFVGGLPVSNASAMDKLSDYNTWLTINGKPASDGLPAAGSVAAISDFETFLLDNITTLRHNVFTWAEHFNLFAGSESYQYSPYDEYYWNVRHNTYTGDEFTTFGLGGGTYKTNKHVGQSYTGLAWNEYLKTEEGQALALSMKMSTPIPYLLGSKNIPYLRQSGAASSDESDIAPYWYVRHGINDNDAGFAVEALLYYAMLGCKDIKNLNFSFTWNKPHSGSYDNQESFAWIDSVLADSSVLPFEDVADSDWYCSSVKYAYGNGLMNGVSNTSFAPRDTVSRAMTVTVLYRMAGSPSVSGKTGFTDLDAEWYTDAVIWAANAGIVNGVSDTVFNPDGAVTREQLSAMLYRYALHQSYDVSGSADLSGFADSSVISSYAAEAMAWANAEGLITGESADKLNPSGESTRAVLAAVLSRFCEANLK